MSDYEFPQAPELERVYRAAHRALSAIVPQADLPEDRLDFHEVLSGFPVVMRAAELEAARQVGPRVTWQAPARDGDWDLIQAGIDLDSGGSLDDGMMLGGLAEGDCGGWPGSPLNLAARAYRKDAGWDFSPPGEGIWLVMLAPVSATGFTGGPSSWGGHLAGFAVLYDRDQDGRYESAGHVWTARAWRRRGIASRLLAAARRLSGPVGLEEPYTADGAALARAVQDAAAPSPSGPARHGPR